MQMIRAMRSTDVEQVLAVDATCFSDPWTEEMWRSELARSDVSAIVFEKENEVVGFALTTVLFEDAELPKIAVLPAFRGQGLGLVLLKKVLERAKTLGAEKMFLEVRLSNAPARKLYESNGFTVLRVRRGYYFDGEDALEMQKIL